MEIVWDPRKMISKPFVDCPACKQVAFGTLMISNNYWTRRCRACMHTGAPTRLPELQKRIVYLDQMVLSNIAKALDPVWRANRGPQEAFWLELFEQLERLVKLQLVVCVESPMHDQESSVTPYPEVLRRLREYLSAKVEFDSGTVVLQRQLHHALNAVETGTPITLDTYLGAGAEEGIHGRLNQWSDRLQISVNFNTTPEEIAAFRTTRDQGGEVMAQIWARWATQRGSFEDWYRAERTALYPTWLASYQEHLRRYARRMDGLELTADELEALINLSMPVTVIFGFIHRFTEKGLSFPEAHQRLRAFFSSDAALNAPANDISSLLFAALARKAASGQKKVPNRGTPNDISVISSYLPYCEAMFVDDQFAGLMQEVPLGTRLRTYETRVFSNRTRIEFLDYLKRIEAEAPAEHLMRVEEVYGSEWLQSYRSILEHERERRGTGNSGESPPSPLGPNTSDK